MIDEEKKNFFKISERKVNLFIQALFFFVEYFESKKFSQVACFFKNLNSTLHKFIIKLFEMIINYPQSLKLYK